MEKDYLLLQRAALSRSPWNDLSVNHVHVYKGTVGNIPSSSGWYRKK
jgi:hypothetical protein